MATRFEWEKIWQNESNGTVPACCWNAGKLSLHLELAFIWYPEGVRARSKKAFPNCSRSCKRHVAIPAWLNQSTACPWNSRANFPAANSTQMRELATNFSRAQSM